MNKKITGSRVFVCRVLAMLVVCGVPLAEDIQTKVMLDKNKHEVKYSEFEKDGVLYRSYDFGKAVFTVDANSMSNHSDNKTAEAFWYWPGLISSDNISREQAKNSSWVRVQVDFEDGNHYPDGNDSLEYWAKHNCGSTVGQKDDTSKEFWCFQEMDSEYAGLKKFGRGWRKEAPTTPDVIVYVAPVGGAKSPQGTPLVISCSFDLGTPVVHPLKDDHCGVNFHYYDQVSVAVQFRGDVLPQWQELVTGIDIFFKSRMQ